MHALINFRQYLVGNKFVVKIDHNSLRYCLTQKDLNERQQKWASKIQAFGFDIEYVKGKNNVVVDSLSRIYVTWFGFGFGFGELQVRFGFEFSDGVRMGFSIGSSIYIFQYIYRN